MNTIKPETIVAIELFYSEEEIPNKYNRDAVSDDTIEYMLSGNASEEDFIEWEYEVTKLAGKGYLYATRVENILGCFTEEECEYIIDWINDCCFVSNFEELVDLLWKIRCNTSWISDEEKVSDDYIVFASEFGKYFVWAN